MFSKACEYAIRATIFVAGQSIQQQKAGQKLIANAINSPEAFTAKTLQKLTRSGVISSDKGPNGGFYMNATQLSATCLKDIVLAIDGDGVFTNCGLGLQKCNDKKPCPLHYKFTEVRNGLQQMMETTSLMQLAKELKKGDSYLKQ